MYFGLFPMFWVLYVVLPRGFGVFVGSVGFCGFFGWFLGLRCSIENFGCYEGFGDLGGFDVLGFWGFRGLVLFSSDFGFSACVWV